MRPPPESVVVEVADTIERSGAPSRSYSSRRCSGSEQELLVTSFSNTSSTNVEASVRQVMRREPGAPNGRAKPAVDAGDAGQSAGLVDGILERFVRAW